MSNGSGPSGTGPFTEAGLGMEGRFAYMMQGLLEADPFAEPESKDPVPEAHGQKFTNPTVVLGFQPPTVDLKTPRGYYPYSEAGYFDFRSDDRTFTGKFWINIAGNPAPNAQSQDFSGRYLLNLDGSGTLTFLENGIALGEAFIVATNLEADFLIMWSWTKRGPCLLIGVRSPPAR